MSPIVARSIAAVGAVLSLAAIWVKSSSSGGKYWDSPHHGLGITILVLGIAAGVGVLLAFLLRNPLLDRLWLIAGLLVGGFLLLIPINFISYGETSNMGAGMWIGAAAAIVFTVAAALLPVSAAHQSSPSYGYAPATSSPPQHAQPPEAPPASAPTPAPTPPPAKAPEPAPAAASTTPAGWYSDPTGQSRLRYWDGSTWTESTSA